MQKMMKRLSDVTIIIALSLLIPRNTDFNNLTVFDYVLIIAYILIIVLFIANLFMEYRNRDTEK